MAKKSGILAQIEARYAAEYQLKLEVAKMDYQKQLDICLQMGMDAACIAANDILHMGSGRAWAFLNAYKESFNDICKLINDDSKDDDDIQHSTDLIDRRLKSIVGKEHFAQWEDRYREVRVKLFGGTSEVAVWEPYEISGYLRCSNCKDVYIDADWLEDGKWSFCPNCGRRMKKDGRDGKAGA